MAKLTPKKLQNVPVVRVSWRKPICMECYAYIVADCKDKGITRPAIMDKEFMVPMAWLNFKCSVTQIPPVISFYEARSWENGTSNDNSTPSEAYGDLEPSSNLKN